MKSLRTPLLFLAAFAVSTLSAQRIELSLPVEPGADEDTLWVALKLGQGIGSSIVELDDGRRVFLAFQADAIVAVKQGQATHYRRYANYHWQDQERSAVELEQGNDDAVLRVDAPGLKPSAVQWFTVDVSGVVGAQQEYATRLGDEIYLPRYYSITRNGSLELRGRFGALDARPRIYQMLPRLFGNANETRKLNGTLNENGTGRFSDLSSAVLDDLQADGITHLWLTGLLQQATSTDYSLAGQPADDPDLLKGIAGSPYAIKDYFDVCPDYADDPARRLEEFEALCERMHAAGLKVVIDFVPNHVARSYASDIHPELAFGVRDNKSVYFDPDNNFFYLTGEVAEGGAPLRLPTVDPGTGEIINETARLAGNADGYYMPEKVHGRVTGNNVASWRPSNGDWYETVKLNYGFDFLNRDRAPDYPSAVTPKHRMRPPDTWKKMDAVIAYWQELGVDGFRVDMAHMVPPEFWKWLIHRARERNAEVFFYAEAYNDDPAKVHGHDPALRSDDNVLLVLLDAGFDAVYDDAGYDSLEHVYGKGAWLNDLQQVEDSLGSFVFDCAVRYAENHDEIRLAHPDTWGGLGMEVGRPVTATLWGLSRGPVMLYHGQEVGEPALGREGFGGDDQRTTIFDYWSMPEFNKWWNDGAADGALLSDEQRALRAWYVRLLNLLGEPAFEQGNAIPLNAANRDNPFYGKIADVGPSGNWFYAYLRHDPDSESQFLVAANFHAAMPMRHVRIRLSDTALDALDLDGSPAAWLVMRDRLSESGESYAMRVQEVLREGIYLKELPALNAAYYELQVVDELPAGAVEYPSLPAGKAYLGAPPLLRLQAGTERSIDLRRFGNPGESHRFACEAIEGVDVRLDHANHRLTIRADRETKGLHVLDLSLINQKNQRADFTCSLALAVESLPVHRFEIKGYGSAQSVRVAGSFNAWNSSADQLRRVGDAWVLERSFTPGRYAYKYVIDGNWITDPANPNIEREASGNENSILQVDDPSGESGPTTLIVESLTDSQLSIISDQSLGNTVLAEALPIQGGAIRLPVALKEGGVGIDLSAAPEDAVIRVIAEDLHGRVALPVLAYPKDSTADHWRDDIIYYAFTDRFYDGEPANTVMVDHPEVYPPANYQGGDFQGIQQKLEDGYFEDLGVNVLWLAPLNQNPDGAWQEYLEPFRHYTGYHGYWPVERYGVERRFGGEEALRDLVGSAHEDGMKVLADLVLKHVHSENPIRSERPDLFGQLELADGSRNLRRWNDNPFTTWFEPFLPAFDFRNPDAINFLLEDAVYWINEYDLDGYRLDAVKHIRPDFWWRFRSRMRDSFPGVDHYFVGETFQNREGIADFVGPNMLDGQFDFPLYDMLMECFAKGTAGFEQLEAALNESEQVYGRSARMSALVGNHDKSRFMAYADGDLPDPEEPDDEELGWAKRITVDSETSYEKLKLAMTFILTIDGVPMIYYGDEIGMTGAGDPDNRRMMRFGDAVSDAETRVKEHFSKLAHTRRANPALYLGSRRTLEAGGPRYAYIRRYGDDVALVLFNQSDEKQHFRYALRPELDDGVLTDALSDREVEVRAGQVDVLLEPMQSAVYVLNL